MSRDDPFDDHGLGEAAIIVERAVDVLAEELGPAPARPPRRARISGPCPRPGTASARDRASCSSKRREPGTVISSGATRPSAGPSIRRRPAAHSRSWYWCLYSSGSRGVAAARFDLVGQLHHLIDRLLAVEPHDEFFDVLVQLLARFVACRSRPARRPSWGSSPPASCGGSATACRRSRTSRRETRRAENRDAIPRSACRSWHDSTCRQVLSVGQLGPAAGRGQWPAPGNAFRGARTGDCCQGGPRRTHATPGESLSWSAASARPASLSPALPLPNPQFSQSAQVGKASASGS